MLIKRTNAFVALIMGALLIAANASPQADALIQPPEISGFTPLTGRPGTVVTVQGANFVNVGAVRFGSIDATAFTFATSASGTVVVPPGAQTGPITITAEGGKTSSSQIFTVDIQDFPVIERFSPSSGGVGSTVELVGTNLVDIISVRIGSITVPFDTVGNVVSFTIPEEAVTGTITIETQAGAYTTTDVFTVVQIGAPQITEFSPKSGQPGTSLSITGTNFVGVTAVRFNGVPSTFHVLGEATISAKVPDNATTGPITVEATRGSATTSESFTVIPASAPTLTGFTPLSGKAGASVEISGSNLDKVTDVKFGGVTASFVHFFGTIYATVPVGAVTGPITLVSPLGNVSSTSNFTVEGVAAPQITGFSPASGAPGTIVQIQGANFIGVSTVRFGSVMASYTISGGDIFATVPENASTGPISVVTAGGTATSAGPFTVVARPAPVLFGFSPTSGEAGTWVDIQGTNLDSVISVAFNGVEAASFTNAPGGFLAAQVPTNAVSGPITVRTPGGTAISSEVFTFINPLAITLSSFSPAEGAAGTVVAVRGTNFNSITGALIGGVAAEFILINDELAAVTVPTNAVTGPISLVNSSGSYMSEGVFTVLDDSVIDPPVVSIELGAAGKVQISWPEAAAVFKLQQTSDLGNGEWADSPATGNVSDGRKRVEVEAGGAMTFYRLVKP